LLAANVGRKAKVSRQAVRAWLETLNKAKSPAMTAGL